MNKVKSIVIDDFFPDPDAIRNWGLSLQYYDKDQLMEVAPPQYGLKYYYPGVRSLPLSQLKSPYSEAIQTSIATMSKQFFGLKGQMNIITAFQLTTEQDYVLNNIHVDSGKNSAYPISVASVIYLTPNAPYDTGTNIYTDEEPHDLVDSIGNLYNRVTLYKSESYHRANRYFGDNLENGRLTLVSFIRNVT